MFRRLVLLVPSIFFSQVILFRSFSAADPLFWYCPAVSGYAPEVSIYTSNQNELMTALASNAQKNNGFYNQSIGTSPNEVYGLVMCFADATQDDCNNCLANVNSDTTCENSYDASKFYKSCFVRFSNYSFFSHQKTGLVPSCGQSTPNVSVPNFLNSPSVQLLTNSLTTEASNSVYRYATGNTSYTTNQTLQMLLQCTRDLLPDECRDCISSYISYASQNGDNCSDWQGAKITGPSCYIRYELYPFYVVNPPVPANPPTPASGASRNGKKSNLVIAIVVSTIATFLMLAASILCICKRQRRKDQKSRNRESDTAQLKVSMDSSLDALRYPGLEFTVYDLRMLKEVTNNFSVELGRGGFGPVYKGTLPDGQEIAVKRLSGSTSQGIKEFKNEVDLLRNLKHRNLVELLGCCMQEEEKLLCYEYLPNGSLDKILFEKDLVKRAQLDWRIRYKIIEGISRGLLYLHEGSRMKIIHRDLKASNILVNTDMSPKISDFGLARFFEDDQTQKDTSIIAGTFGYMAPEYVMHGNFSAKSDVYSFGVLILEIVMGRKNNSFAGSNLALSIVSYALKHWRNGEVHQLKDPVLNYESTYEIPKCVHIALLCVQDDPNDRPNMEMINLMLSDSVAIPAIRSPRFHNMIDVSSSEEFFSG